MSDFVTIRRSEVCPKKDKRAQQELASTTKHLRARFSQACERLWWTEKKGVAYAGVMFRKEVKRVEELSNSELQRIIRCISDMPIGVRRIL